MKSRTYRADGGKTEEGVKVTDSDKGADWYSGDTSNVKKESEQPTGFKKGGKVASKAAGQSEGFKSMASTNAKTFEGAGEGVAPKKPSVAERRRAMNPNQYAKGGKVAHKQLGWTLVPN